MSTDDKLKNKEKLIKFAIDELKKTITSIKNGKNPETPDQLRRMFQILNESHKKSSENDVDNILSELIKNIDTKDEEKK